MFAPAAANAAPAARKSLSQAIADMPAIIDRMNAPLPVYQPVRSFVTAGHITGAPGFCLYLSIRHGVCSVDLQSFRYGTKRRAANLN